MSCSAASARSTRAAGSAESSPAKKRAGSGLFGDPVHVRGAALLQQPRGGREQVFARPMALVAAAVSCGVGHVGSDDAMDLGKRAGVRAI